MKSIIRKVGYIIFVLAGLFQFFFWISALDKWLGFLGVFLGITILSPGVVIFPLVFWIVEKVFPISYFLILIVGFGGILLAGLCSDD